MARSSTSRRGTSGPLFGPATLLVAVAATAAIALMLVVGSTDEAAARCPDGEECVVVHTDSGAHLFTVEWAIEAEERRCGLMFREEMAADHGMMFDFQTERPVSFWMMNTLISLDMVFIRDSGEVLNIAEDTTPLSLDSVPSAGPVRYVLEVIAGTADRIGLEPGDTIDFDRIEDMTEGTAICFPPI